MTKKELNRAYKVLLRDYSRIAPEQKNYDDVIDKRQIEDIHDQI
jgi:hypothetical protein